MKKQTNEEILNKIKEDFNNFYKQTGKYPTAQEIDSNKYMISTRTIQRRFGGLVKVRELLNIPITNFTKGNTRSLKAKYCLERGLNLEDEVLEILKKKFPIQTIHQQAIYFDNYRSDFLVYNKTKDFYIDVFYTENIDNFNGILNLKLNKYSYIKDNPIYFIVKGVKYTDIKDKLKNKLRYIPNNIKIISIEELKEELKEYIEYQLL